MSGSFPHSCAPRSPARRRFPRTPPGPPPCNRGWARFWVDLHACQNLRISPRSRSFPQRRREVILTHDPMGMLIVRMLTSALTRVAVYCRLTVCTLSLLLPRRAVLHTLAYRHAQIGKRTGGFVRPVLHFFKLKFKLRVQFKS